MAFNNYFDFQLGNKRLSDFGGILHNGDKGSATFNLISNMNKQTDEFPGIDGMAYYSSSYQPKPIPLNILIENENFNQDEFIDWIKSKEEQWFNYIGDNKKIKVVYDSDVELNVYNAKQALTEITFIAYYPFWSLINDVVWEQTNPSLNTSYSFTNLGNDESFPLIELNCTTNQTIIFQINQKSFKLKDIIGTIFIDCYTETVYKIIGNSKVNYLGSFECTNGEYKYEFQSLVVGNNTFKLTSGSVNKVKINCNSRFA